MSAPAGRQTRDEDRAFRLSRVSSIGRALTCIRRCDAPARVLAFVLLSSAVTVVLFLVFHETPTEVGALTDSAATSIAVEAEVIGFMSDESPAMVPERWPAQVSSTTTEPYCGRLVGAGASFSGYPSTGVRIRGTARIGYGQTPGHPCPGISVGGASVSVTWKEHPTGNTRSATRSGGCSASGKTAFSCSIGAMSRPSPTQEDAYWYITRWSVSCPSVTYLGRTVSARCSRPKPPPPPPTPTPRPPPIAVSSIEITSSPAALSTYAIDETIEVNVAFGEDVTIETNSPPTLRLSLDSGPVSMAYDRLANSRDMYFTHTVAEGDIDENGVAIPENPVSGHVYKDGRKGRVLHEGLESDPGHKVDGVRPKLTALSFDQSRFVTLRPDDTIGYILELVATFDEDVRVAGDPEIAITVNGESATSTYATTTTEYGLNGRFRYVLPRSGDLTESATTTVVGVPAGEVTLDDDDTVRDRAGNDAVLDYGELATSSMTTLDRIGPILLGLSIEGDVNVHGWLRLCKLVYTTYSWAPTVEIPSRCERLEAVGNGRGEAIVVAQFNEVLHHIFQTTDLDVLLSDGQATSTSGTFIDRANEIHDMDHILFHYFVKAGEYAPAGISVPPGTLDCPCYDIDDQGDEGNRSDPTDLTHVGLPVQPQYKIDGQVPTISRLTMLSEAPGREGWYGIGDTIRIGVEFSEPVLVGSYGPPSSTSTSTATSSVNVFIPNSGGSLRLPLDLDSATSSIEISRRPGDIVEQVHDFRFIVSEGDGDPTGVSVAANSLIRTQVGTSTDPAHNNRRAVVHDLAFNHMCEGGVDSWRIQLSADGPLGGAFETCDGGQDRHPSLAAQVDHKVDGTRPVLQAVEISSTPTDPDGYAIGEQIRVTATFSERVWVQGAPIVSLRVGDDLREMTYDPETITDESGTIEYIGVAALTFVYVVEEGDEDTDGLSIPENALNPMGARIDDVSRNEVLGSDIAHDAVDTDAAQQVDGIRATVASARFVSTPSATSTEADTYLLGDEVAVAVTFSEPVDTYPDGALMDLEMTLADMSTTTLPMVADGVTSTTTVVFRYIITDADQGIDLKVPEDPFGTPVSDLLDQVTATTTLQDLLADFPVALNIVDAVSNASDLGMDELNYAKSTHL